MSYRFSLVTTRHVARRLAACETTAQPHCRSGRKRPCRALALRQALVVPHEASVCRRRCVAALRGSRVLSAGARVGARGGESRTRGIYASTHRVLSVRGRRPVGMRPVGTPISSRFTRRRALTDMTFPSSLLGPTSRAQVDGLDPADGSKTSGHRRTWSVYELSRVRIERIEHHGGPGQDRLRLRRESKSHLESMSFDVRPSVHSGRLRGPSGLGPSPRAGTHGVALHFEIIAH